MTELAQKWLDKQTKQVSADHAELLKRCVNVLESNTYTEDNLPWSPIPCISPCKNRFEGIWNWDSAFHAMAVSRWDKELAWGCINAILQYQRSDGVIPDVMFITGELIDQTTKPPVFPMAVRVVYDNDNNLEQLKNIYPKLVLNEQYWLSKRFYNGLFYYDCDIKDEKSEKRAKFESGWDDSVRWDTLISDQWAVDLNCFMVIFYREMAYFAEILGIAEDIEKWKTLEEKLTEQINLKLWDKEKKYYADANKITGEVSKVLTPASFMPLYAKIATTEQAEAMGKIAADPNIFNSRMPTVSFDNPEYSTTYWRGPTWLNVAYFAAKGLKNYNLKVADDIKDTILSWAFNEKRGIFENYDSKTGEGLYCEPFSWSAVFIIEFILNF